MMTKNSIRIHMSDCFRVRIRKVHTACFSKRSAEALVLIWYQTPAKGLPEIGRGLLRTRAANRLNSRGGKWALKLPAIKENFQDKRSYKRPLGTAIEIVCNLLHLLSPSFFICS
jgi:hypothetical protein